MLYIILFAVTMLLLVSITLNISQRKRVKKLFNKSELYVGLSETFNGSFEHMQNVANQAISELKEASLEIHRLEYKLDTVEYDRLIAVFEEAVWKESAKAWKEDFHTVQDQYVSLLAENIMLEDTIDAIYEKYDESQESNVN